jgi:hypothetical protein
VGGAQGTNERVQLRPKTCTMHVPEQVGQSSRAPAIKSLTPLLLALAPCFLLRGLPEPAQQPDEEEETPPPASLAFGA